MKKNGFLLLVVVFALTACSPEKRKADISDSDVEVKIGRFDQDFWAMNRSDLPQALSDLNKLYPDVLPVYLERVVEFGKVGDAQTIQTLNHFFADTAVIRLYTDSEQKFQQVSSYETELTDAFRRAHYFFPERQIPKLYMHVSGLNQSMVVGEGFISASIDTYLGADYPLYDRIGIYSYLYQNMIPEKLVPDYVVAWLTSEFPFVPHTGELMEELLYRGKILYVASVLLPNFPESLLIGYTSEQWQWCKDNEANMWLAMISGKHLFSRDHLLRVKYLNDAPFTSLFSQASPGRAGAYVGWQIIESYMDNNQDVTPAELMNMVNANTLLQKSDYNPR